MLFSRYKIDDPKIEQHRMKILVVDDERDVQVLFEQRFRREIRNQEIEFAFACSGEDALQYLDDIRHRGGLILSDINMPGMSGLELLGLIKSKYEEPPPSVVMITAYGDQESRQTAMRLGADDFLTKPLDFSILKEKLKALEA
jgi:CheY-like chemotaxis protein